MKRKNIRSKRKDRKTAFGVCDSVLLKLQPHFCSTTATGLTVVDLKL